MNGRPLRATAGSLARLITVLLGIGSWSATAAAQPLLSDNLVSPARQIDREVTDRRRGEPLPPPGPQVREVRRIDGRDNNARRASMGATLTPLRRSAPIRYADDVSVMMHDGLPGARQLSNAFAELPPVSTSDSGPSDLLWQWGQFLDHDLSLTEGMDPPEPMPIDIPPGDPWFDPEGDGDRQIGFNRSLYDAGSGTSRRVPRRQLNEVTSWIDASNVYGSDAKRARALRTLDGTGRLKTSAGGLLPFNVAGLSNAGGRGQHLFLAGDVRANEQLGLTAMHTLFVREHNRLIAHFGAMDPALDGEALYQKARRVVGGQMQHITYVEFLPTLLGRKGLSRYRGYRAHVDATLSNLFTTAYYRWGHSALNGTIARLDAQGLESAHGHLALRSAFFRPDRLASEGGIEPLLRGLASQVARPIDLRVVDDVRNFLFGEPGGGGFDLFALNVQRGRDHGLASYNQARRSLGLKRRGRYSAISSDRQVNATLASLYRSVDDIDAWVGVLAEHPVRGSLLGPLAHRALKQQFERLRDGDRFWYRRDLQPDEMAQVASLTTVIRRNTSIGAELSETPFTVEAR